MAAMAGQTTHLLYLHGFRSSPASDPELALISQRDKVCSGGFFNQVAANNSGAPPFRPQANPQARQTEAIA